MPIAGDWVYLGFPGTALHHGGLSGYVSVVSKGNTTPSRTGGGSVLASKHCFFPAGSVTNWDRGSGD